MTKHARKSKQRQVLNVRLVVITVIALAIVVSSGFIWHSYRVSQLSKVLLERADKLLQAEDWSGGATYLHRYLKMRPDDDEVRIRLATVYDNVAEGPNGRQRAIELYSRAVSVAPERNDLRARLAELLLLQGRLSPALQQVDVLLNNAPENALGLKVKALASYAQSKSLGRAARIELLPCFEAALVLQPGDIQLAKTYAMLSRQVAGASNQKRNGELADEAMDRMVEANSDSADALVSRYLYRKEHDLPNAEEDIKRALKLAPDHTEALLLAAGLALSNGTNDEARQLYELASKKPGAGPIAYLGMADSYVAMGNVEQAIVVLREGLKAAHVKAPLMQLKLAQLLTNEGQLKEANDYLNSLEELTTRYEHATNTASMVNMRANIQMARATWHLANDEMYPAISQLKEIILSRGTMHGDQALRLKGWLLLGDVYSRQGEWDSAATAFDNAFSTDRNQVAARLAAARAWAMAGQLQLAIRRCGQLVALGDCPPEAWLLHARLQRQEQLLRPSDERDWSSITATLDKAEVALPQSWEVALLRVRLMLEQSDSKSLTSALEVLSRLEQQHPNNEQLWSQLVLTYERLDRPQDAERAIEHIHSLSSRVSDPEILRSQSLARRGNIDEARKILRQAADASTGDHRVHILKALAQLERSTGQPERARDYLIELINADKTDVGVLRQLVELSLESRDLTKAERWENRLREVEGESGTFWRLYRAERLVKQSTGNKDPKLKQATELYEQISSRRPAWHAALVLRGMIANRLGNTTGEIEAYREAVRLGSKQPAVYERLVQQLLLNKRHDEARELMQKLVLFVNKPSPTHRVLLARLYEATGELSAAKVQLAYLVKEFPKNASYLGLLTNFLLRQGSVEEASSWLDQLEKLAPQDLATVSIRVRWLKAQNRVDEIESRVEAWAENNLSDSLEKGVRKQRMLGIAQLYVEIGEPKAARKWYGRLAEEFKDGYRALAYFLVKQGNTSAAIDVCIEAWDREKTAQAAIDLASVILKGNPTSVDYQRSEQIIKDASSMFPVSADIAYNLGNVRLKQHRIDEAIVLLGRAVQLRPKDFFAWNNLAAVLSERPESRSRALECIENALNHADKEIPMLMDTKATVLLHQGEPRKAIQILDDIVTSPGGSDPRYYLHLAMAYECIGDHAKVRESLKVAEELGLGNSYLTSLEQSKLKKIRQSLLN